MDSHDQSAYTQHAGCGSNYDCFNYLSTQSKSKNCIEKINATLLMCLVCTIINQSEFSKIRLTKNVPLDSILKVLVRKSKTMKYLAYNLGLGCRTNTPNMSMNDSMVNICHTGPTTTCTPTTTLLLCDTHNN